MKPKIIIVFTLVLLLSLLSISSLKYGPTIEGAGTANEPYRWINGPIGVMADCTLRIKFGGAWTGSLGGSTILGDGSEQNPFRMSRGVQGLVCQYRPPLLDPEIYIVYADTAGKWIKTSSASIIPGGASATGGGSSRTATFTPPASGSHLNCLSSERCRQIDQVWQEIRGTIGGLGIDAASGIWDSNQNKWRGFNEAHPDPKRPDPISVEPIAPIRQIESKAKTPGEKKMAKIYRDYQSSIEAASRDHDVPISLLVALIATETLNGQPDEVSKCGAAGIMQLIPVTARGMGLIVPTYDLVPIGHTDCSAVGFTHISKCYRAGGTVVGCDLVQDERFNAQKSINAGGKYLDELYKNAGNDWHAALKNYHGSKVDAKNEAYAKAVEKRQETFQNLQVVGRSTNLVPVTGTNINGYGNEVGETTLEAFQKAAQDFGQPIRVTSGVRTVEEQATLFYDNCIRGGPKSCNPITCRPVPRTTSFLERQGSTYVLKGSLAGKYHDKALVVKTLTDNGNANLCPHTRAYALDAWCEGGGNWMHDPQCQLRLQKTMVRNGFCRLKAESWHFELAAESVSYRDGYCIRSDDPTYWKAGTAYDPTAGNCKKYHFKNDQCVEN